MVSGTTDIKKVIQNGSVVFAVFPQVWGWKHRHWGLGLPGVRLPCPPEVEIEMWRISVFIDTQPSHKY